MRALKNIWSTLPNMQAATGMHGTNPKSDIRIIASTKKINKPRVKVRANISATVDHVPIFSLFTMRPNFS